MPRRRRMPRKRRICRSCCCGDIVQGFFGSIWDIHCTGTVGGHMLSASSNEVLSRSGDIFVPVCAISRSKTENSDPRCGAIEVQPHWKSSICCRFDQLASVSLEHLGSTSVFCLNDEVPCFRKLGVEAHYLLVVFLQASRRNNFLGRIRCQRRIPEHEEGCTIYLPACRPCLEGWRPGHI